MTHKSNGPAQNGGDRPLPLFARFSRMVERQVGQSSTFVLAVGIVLLWAVSGPVFQWSDTWQLVINTGTTIITFLMVFVIQNTQSRDTTALHLKLDELIRVSSKARDELVGVEEMSEKDISEAREAFEELADAGETVVKAASTAKTPARKAKRRRAPARTNGRKPTGRVAESAGATAPVQ